MHRIHLPHSAIGLALAISLVCSGCGPSFVSDSDSGMDSGNQDTEDTDSDDGGPPDTESESDPDGGADASEDSGQVDTDTETETVIPTGDGTCVPTSTLVAGLPVSGTTSGQVNDTFAYSCSALDVDGPDLAFQFTNTTPEPVLLTASLAGYGEDMDLFILADTCSHDACVAYSATSGDGEETSTVVAPSQQVFVVVDGYGGASGTFLLSASASPIELDCTGGVDNDADGLTDCADDDCAMDPDCIQVCSQDQIVQCGDLISTTTDGAGNDMEIYSYYSDQMDGPERIFALDLGPEIDAEVTLSAAATGLELIVLSDICTSTEVFAAGETSVPISSPADSTYFLVVDGLDGAQGSFQLDIACSEKDCTNGLDDDLDTDFDCDDDDCTVDVACAQVCDLLSVDAGCPYPDDAGIGCYLLNPSPVTGYCHEAGDAGVGSACDESHDCIAGAICTPANICLMTCDLDDGLPTCDEGDCLSLGIDPLGICW